MWLETVLLIEVAAAFWLSALNVALLSRVIGSERARARRTAAFVLASVCGAQSLEAVLFLWQGEASSTEGGLSGAALLLVRTALLASTALVSALLLRASYRSR